MRRILPLVVAATMGAAALLGPTASAAGNDTTITLVTHDSFAVSKRVLHDFTAKTGIHVRVLPSGDAGAALNQVILTKDHPLGDVFFGVDNTFLSRALAEHVFEPYTSPELGHVPAALKSDPTHQVTPIDHGDVCINDDKQWFADHHVAPPKTLADLTKPKYRGKLVVENPATSSPGLAFLLATIDRYGDKGAFDYWKRLRANDVQVVSGWEEAYDGVFSAGEGHGDRPLVVSYASSPPAAVYYADPRPKKSPIGTMLDSCFRQIEYAGVIRGTPHARAAHALVDFMLSRKFQQDIPLQMFVFPARDDAKLPALFTKFADVAPHPATLTPARIGAHREQWIKQWTDTVLH
jgi:thiamine transport system substrate-binding protein